MRASRTIDSYLMDMDGVIVHEAHPIPGADQFIRRLQEAGYCPAGSSTRSPT